MVALDEYVEALTRAPVGGSLSTADNAGIDAVEQNEYLMNFSVTNIYRYGPDWRKVMGAQNDA